MDQLPMSSLTRSTTADDNMATFTLSSLGSRRTSAGLPVDIDQIGVASEASFKLGERAPVRSLAVEALPLPGPGALRGAAVGTAGGASMGGLSLTSAMFDGAAAAGSASGAAANGGRGEAPLLSRFYRLQKATSYRSAADLSRTMLDLETAFANSGVQWRLDGAAVARYECDAFVQGGSLEFTVACFREGAASGAGAQGQGHGHIVVDVVPLSGCCAAFSSFYADLASNLAFAAFAETERRPGQKGQKGQKRRRFAAPPLPHTVEVPAEAARTEAARLRDMYADGCSADAARAVAIKAASPESAPLFFGTGTNDASEDAPTQLANAVAEAMLSDDTATALLACATIANLASWVDSDSAAGRKFLAAVIPAIKEQIEDSECAHTRRECLRALSSMATSRPNTSFGGGAYTSLRANIVRAGMVDLLELEAQAGAEEGRTCEDHMARGFATSALVACRA